MTGEDDSSRPSRLGRGARVRMSPLGRERHPRYGDRQGVIVGQGSPSSWRVKFDERVTVQAIHEDYLERVPPRERSPNGAPGLSATRTSRS
jgi:hypothetical protein